MTPRIEYVPHHRIHRQQWDAALKQCANRLIYARSVYLDTMCNSWDALILGNYEYIMPLPRKKKWGFRYLPDIPFLQQLGIFSPHPVTQDITTAFLQAVQKHFSYGNIYLNTTNPVAGVNTEPLNNYVLSLAKPYSLIAAGYEADMHYDLRQANKYLLTYNYDASLKSAIAAFRNGYSEKLPHITTETYYRFEELCSVFSGKKRLIVRAVTDESRILSHAILLEEEHRLYNLLSVNTAAGRKQNANHFLYDRLIHEFSGTDYLLDFEGSDIPGIAFFYRHFGAINTPYHRVHINQLPWPLNKWKP
jgi:hypothetical protein